MKRSFAFVLLMLLVIGVLPAGAADAASGVFTLANYIPAESALFVGIRIDDEAVATIDGLIAKIAGWSVELGMDSIEAPTVSDILSGIDAIDAIDGDAVLAWAGDYLAVGMLMPPTDSENPFGPRLSLTVIALDDRAAAESFFLNSDYIETESQSAWTRLDGSATLLLNDEVLIAVNDATDEQLTAILNGDYPRLSNNAAFTAAVATLPEDDYGFGVYGLPEGENTISFAGVTYDQGITVGGTMLDADTLSLDISLPATVAEAYPPLDADFARYIPADSTMFVHSSNLSGLIDAAISAASQTQASGTDPREEIRRGFSTIGLNFDDLMAWTTGDFAFFARLDVIKMLELSFAGQDADYSALNDIYQFGFVIETSDPDASQRLARTLLSFVRMIPTGDMGFSLTVADEQIAGFDASVVTIEGALPTGGSLSYQLALALTDEVFILGTYNGVEASLTRDPGLSGSELAADASRYWLPGASAVWTIDGAIVMQQAAVFALLMQPMIGNVYSDISQAMLDPTGTQAAATPAPMPFNPMVMPEGLEELAARMSELLRHATISTRTLETGTVIRATITLGE